MKREVLRVSVHITGQYRLQGRLGEVGMVAFDGTAEGSGFRGVILPGGVDTQTHAGARFTLSARYMLEGVDGDGRACRIFLENNAETDDPRKPLSTVPTLRTDSPALQWLENARLHGELEPAGPDAVCIHIFAE